MFSANQANRPCAFIECLPHVEGVWETPNIKLHPSQVFLLVNLFGFRSITNGTRRFTEALFAVARKNAKSTLAAGIGLYCFCYENENGAQVISAATTGAQARIIFNVAKKMVEREPDMQLEYDLEPLVNQINRHEIGGIFKTVNSKASTQDGLNPSHKLIDEIHAHKTRDLIDVLNSAEGARLSPLTLYTTTEGYESPGPWAELRGFAFNILNEVVEADHFLVVYFAVDEDRDIGGRKIPADDDFDESTWVKANPLMDVNPHLMASIRKAAISAQQMPGSLSEFRIKRLNRRAASATGWVNLTKWRACSGGFTLEEMDGQQCWAAFDLANTMDMCAWRLLWKIDDTFYTWGRFWVPQGAVAQRTERKSVNYAGWVQSGFVTLCDGDTNDFGIIQRDILTDIRRFNPSLIAYDPHLATQFVAQLIDEGVESSTADDKRGLIQFIQGPRSYAPAMALCETEYISGRLRHGGDPVLTWHMANVIARYNINMNPMPNKQRSADKIDGAVALFMCFGCAAMASEPEPDYKLVIA